MNESGAPSSRHFQSWPHLFLAWSDLKIRIDEINRHDASSLEERMISMPTPIANCSRSTIPILTWNFHQLKLKRQPQIFEPSLQKIVFFNVRDQYSLDVAKLYCSIEPKLSADLTFAFPLPSSKAKPHRIGISLRKAWIPSRPVFPKFHRQRLWKHHNKNQCWISFEKILWRKALVQTLGQLNYPTRVLIMDPEHDLTFGDRSEILSESTIVDEFGKCDIIIAMRLHACIFAAQFGIPFIALNYMPKVGAFCNSINHPYCIDLNDLNGIPDQIEQVFQNYEDIRTSLLNSVQAATLSTNRVFKEAHNHIEISVQWRFFMSLRLEDSFSKQRRSTEDASRPFQALPKPFCRCLLSQTECNEEPWTSPKKFRNPEKRHALGCEGSFSIFTVSRKWDLFENLGTSCFENGIVCHPSFKFGCLAGWSLRLWVNEVWLCHSRYLTTAPLSSLESTQSPSLAQCPQCWVRPLSEQWTIQECRIKSIRADWWRHLLHHKRWKAISVDEQSRTEDRLLAQWNRDS